MDAFQYALNVMKITARWLSLKRRTVCPAILFIPLLRFPILQIRPRKSVAAAMNRLTNCCVTMSQSIQLSVAPSVIPSTAKYLSARTVTARRIIPRFTKNFLNAATATALPTI
jgi:hypothetical protein